MYTHHYQIPAGWPCRYVADAPRCVVGAKGPGDHVPMWDTAPKAATRGVSFNRRPRAAHIPVSGTILMQMFGDDERPGAYDECLRVWASWNGYADTRVALPMRCPSDAPVVEHGWAPDCVGAVCALTNTQGACDVFEARCVLESDAHGAVCPSDSTPAVARDVQQAPDGAQSMANGEAASAAPRARRCVVGKAPAHLPPSNCDDATRALRLPPYPDGWWENDPCYE